MRKLVVTALALLPLAACSMLGGPRSHGLRHAEEIDRTLAAVVAAQHIPGMAAAVIHADGSGLAGAAGVRVLGGHDAVRRDDRFHVGSVVKAMTATLIATVVEEGSLRWSSTVGEALPECRSTMDARYAGVTLAHLLAHEGGVAPFADPEDIARVPSTSGSVIQQRLAFSCHALSLPPVAEPTRARSYSNAGVVIAAAMAEKVSGRSWEDLMRTRILQPLHLATAMFGWPGRDGRPQPWGHWLEAERLVPVDPTGTYQLSPLIAPAGDLALSMPDLARFLAATLRSLRGEGGLLAGETARQMHTARLQNNGLGWGVVPGYLGHPSASLHEGSAGTFEAIVVVVPDSDVAIAIASNAAADVAGAGTKEALKQLLAAYAPPR